MIRKTVKFLIVTLKIYLFYFILFLTLQDSLEPSRDSINVSPTGAHITHDKVHSILLCKVCLRASTRLTLNVCRMILPRDVHEGRHSELTGLKNELIFRVDGPRGAELRKHISREVLHSAAQDGGSVPKVAPDGLLAVSPDGGRGDEQLGLGVGVLGLEQVAEPVVEGHVELVLLGVGGPGGGGGVVLSIALGGGSLLDDLLDHLLGLGLGGGEAEIDLGLGLLLVALLENGLLDGGLLLLLEGGVECEVYVHLFIFTCFEAFFYVLLDVKFYVCCAF